MYPENGQDEIDVPLDITTEPFSDSNDDSHSQSRWQISDQSDFSSLVVDDTSNTYLTTFSVPHMVLISNQKYYVRVRFYDFYSVASDWSGSVEFTTTSFVEDLNSNGIPDADEVDDTVDFNLDGISDNYQLQIIKCVQASDYSEHTTFNDDGQSVTLEVKDGGYGDSDGLANGVIVDPGGIAASGGSSYTIGTSSIGGSGGGGGCFIATAVFGSKFEKHVRLLRRFRDLYLMPFKIGRVFVNTDYRYSPPMADFIANHDTLRAIVRWSLIPLICLSWILLHPCVVYKLLFLALMISTTLICYRKVKLKRQR